MAEPPTCKCGIPTRVKTSWTTENPGKMFYGCTYYEISVPDFYCFFISKNVKFEEVILNSIMVVAAVAISSGMIQTVARGAIN